jgi:hypothetical protein
MPQGAIRPCRTFRERCPPAEPPTHAVVACATPPVGAANVGSANAPTGTTIEEGSPFRIDKGRTASPIGATVDQNGCGRTVRGRCRAWTQCSGVVASKPWTWLQ